MIRLRRSRVHEAEARRVLVDHWYSHAVGHVIEALRRCQGYHACDPTLRPSLVLNGAAPVELAACAPFVERAYSVAYASFGGVEGDPRRALRDVPRDWSYVLHHPSELDADQDRFAGLRAYQAASRRHFRARVRRGIAGQAPPEYAPGQHLRLELPADLRARARDELGGRRTVAVMPAGSGARFLYPSLASWRSILEELERRLPGGRFVLVGRLQTAGGRTRSGIDRREVDELVASSAEAVDAFDRPILEQLALVEQSTLFVSPHTGFGFAAVAVDTPWLTLSGGDWPEYFFNGVPFHSVLPKDRSVPAFARGRTLPALEADEDGEGRRSATSSVRRIREDLGEIGDAAVALVEGRVAYEDALAAYFPRLLELLGGDRAQLFSFDDVHARYV